MKLRQVIGSILIWVSCISIIQSFREYLLSESGDRRYEERSLLERPFRFAGESFTVVDEHPYNPPGEGEYTSEAEVPGTIQVLRNGSPMGAPSRARIRPGRNDLGRYHLWFDAWVFRDRQSGDSALWMARRIQREESRPLFEVTTITEHGTRTRRLLRNHQLAESYPVFRSTQFLRGSSFHVVPLSVLDLFIAPPLLLVFPLGTLAVGLVLVRSRKNRHPGRAAEPAAGADAPLGSI